MLPSITTTLISSSLTRRETENGRTKKRKEKNTVKATPFAEGSLKPASMWLQNISNMHSEAKSSTLHLIFFFNFIPFPPFPPSLSELLSRETWYKRGASINSAPPSFAALPRPQSQTCLQHSTTNCNNTHESMRNKTTKRQSH